MKLKVMKHSVQFDRNRYFRIFLFLDAGIKHLTLLIKVAVAFTKENSYKTANVEYSLQFRDH